MIFVQIGNKIRATIHVERSVSYFCAGVSCPFSFFVGSFTALIRLPTPIAIEPMACAVVLARNAPQRRSTDRVSTN